MKKMKKDWEIFRETKVLGSYRPDAVKLNETPKGDVIAWFDDTKLWFLEGNYERKRDMVIGDMTYHISSVLLDEGVRTSTPTDKLLSHIDMQMENEKAS